MGTRALGFGAIAIALLLAAPPMSAAADAAAWAALRTSGAVVVVRHSYAPGAFDPPGARLDDCSTQRNLDDNGRVNAPDRSLVVAAWTSSNYSIESDIDLSGTTNGSDRSSVVLGWTGTENSAP